MSIQICCRVKEPLDTYNTEMIHVKYKKKKL